MGWCTAIVLIGGDLQCGEDCGTGRGRHPEVSEVCLNALRRYFERKGRGTISGSRFYLTDSGRYLLNSGDLLETVGSYQPMLPRMDDVLFGDAADVFRLNKESDGGRLELVLNEYSSSQYQICFEEFAKLIVELFDTEPLQEQPCYITDLKCGNVVLLRHVYEVIQSPLILASFCVVGIGLLRPRRAWHSAP